MAIPWATNLLHFHVNKLFKHMFCNLAFGLAIFFPNHLVTLIVDLNFVVDADFGLKSRFQLFLKLKPILKPQYRRYLITSISESNICGQG